jgi:hypothetical protein
MRVNMTERLMRQILRSKVVANELAQLDQEKRDGRSRLVSELARLEREQLEATVAAERDVAPLMSAVEEHERALRRAQEALRTARNHHHDIGFSLDARAQAVRRQLRGEAAPRMAIAQRLLSRRHEELRHGVTADHSGLATLVADMQRLEEIALVADVETKLGELLARHGLTLPPSDEHGLEAA